MSDATALALFLLVASALVAYTMLVIRLDGQDDPRRRPPASRPPDPFDPFDRRA